MLIVTIFVTIERPLSPFSQTKAAERRNIPETIPCAVGAIA
jgi:hypothetical protein